MKLTKKFLQVFPLICYGKKNKLTNDSLGNSLRIVSSTNTD